MSTLTPGATEQDWQIRHFIYSYFVDHEGPPTYEQAADAFGIAPEAARRSFERLGERHAVFLEPGTQSVRMANPLSGVPTAYRVQARGRRLWANCAWDSLGIPAMLHADAAVTATLIPSGETVGYAIEGGELRAEPFVVHFPLPFRRWYDDLIHT